MTNGDAFRICPDTGLKFHRPAEALMKANAVAAVVFLLVGGIFGLLVGLTRWPEVHLLDAETFLSGADRPRHQPAHLLDHLLRDGRAAVLLLDAARLPIATPQPRLGRLGADDRRCPCEQLRGALRATPA